MRKIYSNKIIKKLIISVMLIITLSTYIIPNKVQALTIDGGDLAEPIFDFIIWIGDSFLKWMQNIFVGTEDLDNGIKYSPAIIFSGKLPAFDINFIEPDNTVINNEEAVEVSRKEIMRTQRTIEYENYYTTGTGFIVGIFYENVCHWENELEISDYGFAGITFKEGLKQKLLEIGFSTSTINEIENLRQTEKDEDDEMKKYSYTLRRR